MNWIIVTFTTLIYFCGFFVTYTRFRPKDDSWLGWMVDAGLSLIWLSPCH